MKKILLSMIMLCTAVSAWSYETETATISCNDTNTSPFTVNATTASDGMDAEPYWQVGNGCDLKLSAPKGYYVTNVTFATTSGKVERCDKLMLYQMNVWKSQNSDDLQYYDVITFSNPEGSIAKVTSIAVTYHRCSGTTHHDAVSGTCITKGTAEYWECVCGKKYSNEGCTSEVTDMTTLATEKDPTNHPDALEEHARVEATCIKDGSVQYWHCSHCNKNFEDKDGKGNEIVNVVIPKAQGSHNHLSFVAQKDATCTESGVAMNHRHCSDCGKNFEDEACTKLITDEVVIPAINHSNKTFTEAVAPTTEAIGNVACWYCPDCKKHFGDASCTKELTEWTLAKLVNMMHLCFDDTSVPVETEHYMNTAKFNFTEGGDVILTVNDKSVTYDKEMIEKVKFSNGTPTVTISANEDSGKGVYYSTFYSSLESYAVPEGFTAYRGEISDDGTKLNLTSVEDGVMKRGEGYILKGTASSGSMNVTANADGGSTGNKLLGTDVATTLGTNDYALSLGKYGVGFYLWNSKPIGANKAYLTLDDSSTEAKAFFFQFEDGETGIQEASPKSSPEGKDLYNLNGIRVSDSYKGIVIRNGKKVYQR